MQINQNDLLPICHTILSHSFSSYYYFHTVLGLCAPREPRFKLHPTLSHTYTHYANIGVNSMLISTIVIKHIIIVSCGRMTITDHIHMVRTVHSYLYMPNITIQITNSSLYPIGTIKSHNIFILLQIKYSEVEIVCNKQTGEQS